jgi:diguanylate cyclase (GGDEF)-like protein
MLDLDQFKNVNDSYGHKVGDKMLRDVAGIIQNQLLEYDFLARYAGDEFVALVQEVVGIQVEELCIRIENAVSQFSLSVGGNRHARVGISVGTATFGSDGDTLDELLISADDKMYRMKSIHRHERSVPPAPPTSPSEQENLATVA